MLEYKNWRYKNTIFLTLSLLLLFVFADAPIIRQAVTGVGGLGYLGMFLAGMFFVSIFTVAPAGVVLFFFAQRYSVWQVSALAGLGAVAGDYLIFRFLKDGVFAELQPISLTASQALISRGCFIPHILLG